jgi:MFS family permease
MVLIAVGFIITFLLIVILSMLNISFPVIYFKLFEKTNDDTFSTQEIISGLKSTIGKMIIFLLGSIFILLPLAIIVFGILVVLCMILIGIPLLFIVGPAFISWISLSYYEYILKDVGYFTALSNGFNLVKQQFWTTVGTTFLMMILIQIIQGFITMIPYVISMIWMFTSTKNLQETNSQTETLSTMGILIAVIMVFSVLLSYIFNNFILVNQGLIYFGLQEENENHTTKSQIDLIGTDIE